MLVIGGLASGPQIAPTVPPEKYGQAAIAFIVRNINHDTIRCTYVFCCAVRIRVRIQHVLGSACLVSSDRDVRRA
jgi:hypothetical protein